jgi:N,N'-diacetyllegionaminate synthase
MGISAWKIASGELTNLPMIGDMARDGKPMMLSTGMSAYDEIDAAIAVVNKTSSPFAVFQCTTQYPSPPDAIGLNILDDLRARYGCAVGLSDHSGTIYPALAASAAHRAEVIEVHLTLSRGMFGPDVVASVTPAELTSIVDGVRFIERMRAAPLDKSKLDGKAEAMRGIFFKSVVASKDLKRGTVLALGDLDLKKPGNGIPAAKLQDVVGKTLKRALGKDEPLQFADIDAS